jgi:hypothetical protein
MATAVSSKDGNRILKTFRAYLRGDDLSVAHVVDPAIEGGLSIYRNLNLTSTGVAIKGSAGQVYGWYLFNSGAAPVYVKLYNKATAPTVGTDTPVMTIALPAGSGANVLGPIGIPFSLGIGIGAVTGAPDANTTAPSTNQCICNVFYY